MSCPICNSPDYIQCNCNAEPFCQQCSENSICVEKVDAECVIYNRDDSSPSKLTCMGIPNKTSVATILEAIDGFICNINAVQTPLTAIDSPSIDLTAWGTLKHTLQADVNISAASGNTLAILGDGLYVSQAGSQVPITPIDSNSVNLTAFGTLDHTLQADVNVSSASGNTLSVLGDGLYVETGAVDTADNGLTKTGNNIQLGGSLLKETSIQALSYPLNLLTNSSHFNITDGSYNFNIIDGLAPSNFETRFIIGAQGTVLQTTTNGNAALISYYIDNFISSGGSESLIASHYPTTDNILNPPPAIDPNLTSYVKTSLSGPGSTGLIELYSKNVVLNQVQNTVDNTGTDSQSNVLYTNVNGKVCSAPYVPNLKGSAQLDFPSTSAQTSSELTMIVSGVTVGDNVVVNSNINPTNSNWTAYVSATDTVTVRFNNYSSGAIDPALAVINVTIFPNVGVPTPVSEVKVTSTMGGVTLTGVSNLSGFTLATPLNTGDVETGTHGSFTAAIGFTLTGTPTTNPSNITVRVNGVYRDCVNITAAGTYSITSSSYVSTDYIEIFLNNGGC